MQGFMKPYSAGKRYCTTGNYQNLLRPKYNWWLYISRKNAFHLKNFILIFLFSLTDSRLKKVENVFRQRVTYIHTSYIHMHGCMTNQTIFSIHLVIAHLSIYVPYYYGSISSTIHIIILCLCTFPSCQNSRIVFTIAWITHYFSTLRLWSAWQTLFYFRS